MLFTFDLIPVGLLVRPSESRLRGFLPELGVAGGEGWVGMGELEGGECVVLNYSEPGDSIA